MDRVMGSQSDKVKNEYSMIRAVNLRLEVG